MHKKWLPVLLVIVLLALLDAPVFAQGGAMCKTALENPPEGKRLAKSFDYGILFLMGIPQCLTPAACIRKSGSKARVHVLAVEWRSNPKRFLWTIRRIRS